MRRVESLRRERRKGRNNKNDSFANEEEDIEIGRPSIDPNLIENEEQSMPNICLDRQNEAKESKQDHLEGMHSGVI